MKKTFDIDYDDPKDLKKFIVILQKQRKELLRKLGYDEIYFNGSKNNVNKILPLFEQMLQTNLGYEEKNTTNNFYVYFHCNPLKNLNIKSDVKHLFLASKFSQMRYVPFYVGKGTKDRYLELNRNDSHRKIRSQILKFKKDIVPIKVIENLSESQALEYETKFMDILGLIMLSKNGMLVNLDEGKENNKRFIRYNDETGYIKKILKRNGYIPT